MREVWKPVIGSKGVYEVSSTGRVKSLKRKGFHPKNKHGGTHHFDIPEIVMRQRVDRYGYAQIGISRRTKSVHRIVAEAFIPNPRRLPKVNHKNGNRLDNRVANLEWVSAKDNVVHAYEVLGREGAKGSKNSSSKVTEKQILKIRSMYASGKFLQKYLGKKFGLSQGVISNIISRKTWKHV